MRAAPYRDPPGHGVRVKRARPLALLVLLAVLAVAALGAWDETRAADDALADFAHEQVTLAQVAAAGLADSARTPAVVTDALVLLAPSPGVLLDARTHAPLHSQAIAQAIREGGTSVRLTRAEAARLGLPARTAMAGIAAVPGRGSLVVVASAGRERDREIRARWRLVLGVMASGALVVAFGLLAMQLQRNERALEDRLARAGQQRERDAQLERENRAAMMLTLAAGVAHEVSSPLGVIVARAEQLADRVARDDARGQRAVAVIGEQAERIREVIHGFLRLARGDRPVLDPVDPAAVVHGAHALVEHRFATAGVTLEVESHDGLPRVAGDLRLLEHAVVNLLLNACDACEPGGRVTLRVDVADGHVAFAVTDDGHGISATDAARVVEPFFSTKPAGEGTGLGLAVASEIVKIHRGTLALAAYPPRGTQAVVSVPRVGG